MQKLHFHLRAHIAVLFVSFLGACGKSGDLSIEDLDNKNIQGYSSQLTCKDSDNCPSEMALLSYPDPENSKAGFCSGTMIGEETLLTNAHCVPKEIRHNQASCENKIWTVFAKTKNHDELVIECSHVIHVPGDVDLEGGDAIDVPNAASDYAILKLKRAPKRGYLPLSRQGFRANDTVTFFRATPQSNTKRITSVLEKSDCTFNADNQVTKKLITAADAANAETLSRMKTINLENCETIGGNSGTAALVSGSIRGILFGGGQSNTLVTNFAYPALSLLDNITLKFYNMEIR